MINLIFKSLVLAFSYNNDYIFKRVLDHLIIGILEKNYLAKLILVKEFQNLINGFIIGLDDVEKRKCLIMLIVLKINEMSEEIKDLNMMSSFVIKLIQKDMDLINNLRVLLKTNLIERINFIYQSSQPNVKSNNPVKKEEEDVKKASATGIVITYINIYC